MSRTSPPSRSSFSVVNCLALLSTMPCCFLLSTQHCFPLTTQQCDRNLNPVSPTSSGCFQFICLTLADLCFFPRFPPALCPCLATLDRFLRKEVIQPQLPLQLPCYDFVPVIRPAFGGRLLAVTSPTSGMTNSHDVTGGVYKARERIQRAVLMRVY